MARKTLRLALGLAGPAREVKFEAGDDLFEIELDGERHEFPLRFDGGDEGELILESEGRLQRIFWVRDGETVHLSARGRSYRVTRRAAEAAEAAGNDASHAELVAPMTGKVAKVLKAAGDLVEDGETVLIVEAMKMEHQLRAPFPARVESVDAEEGAQVDMGQVLARLDRVEPASET